MKLAKRLTPIIVASTQPVLFVDEKIHTDSGGGPTEGIGFPQWSKVDGADTAHYFRPFDAYGVSESLCGRVEAHHRQIYLPGDYAHCKDCERRYVKRLRSGRPA